ncbi:MAG: ABC transporter permease subunit [Candidatus Brocadiae bacterium]|nr:ABC transporter permease subunit [Candidatus Brocadiia bacterium]
MQKYLSKFFVKKRSEKQENQHTNEPIQKKLQTKKAFLWVLCCLSFVGIMNWGKISIGENQEVVYFREYFPHLLEKGKDSLSLVLLSLIFTILLSGFFTSLSFLHLWLAKKPRIFFPLFGIVKLLGLLPGFLSSIPLFITGIFLIRILHLDTVNEKNLIYGVFCLALFNLNYMVKRTTQKIDLAYQTPHVLYAHSLGLPEFTIFRYYIMPSIVKDHFTILRELLPHLTIESVIIEYTFGYSALIRSMIHAILYQSWVYFILIFVALLLFLSFFNIMFQFIEETFHG